MGKKSKSKAENAAPSAAAKNINIALIVVALIFTSGIIWYTVKGPSEPQQQAVLPKPETTTLDPEQFTGKTRLAYEAAREVPEVLAQLPCYCGCMTGSGHRNNLDCFHDTHGVECSMCQEIALDARQMYKNGFDIDRIRQTIKDRYSRYASLNE